MVFFVGVSKIFDDPQHGARLFLKDVTVSLPVHRFCEIEAGADEPDPVAKSLFLGLTSGAVKPDHGKVHYGRLRVSPLLNAGNQATLLFNQMTLRQNVSFQAKWAHLDARRLMEFVVGSCSLQDKVDKPVSGLTWPLRRAVEVSIFTAIPYDCYLIDYLDTVPDFAQMQLYYAAKKRGAGMFFATARPGVAKAYRDMSIVVRAGALRAVDHFEAL